MTGKTTRAPRAVLLMAMATAVANSATAQDLIPHQAKQSRTVILDGATIHVGNGEVIESGVLWFRDGIIAGVAGSAAEASLVPDTERIDVTGLHLWPGMISAATTLGLNEIGSLPDTQDYQEIGDLTPEARVAVAINPDSTAIPVTRLNGVLTAGVLPSGGLLPGRLAVIQLDGWTWEAMALTTDAGQVIEWPGLTLRSGRGRRGSDLSPDDARKAATERRQLIDSAFRDARAYLAARAADPTIPRDVRFDALAPVLNGESSVYIKASSAEQIESAIHWARSLDLRAVIVGGTEAHLCLDLLKGDDVGVILTGTHRLPRRRDADVNAPYALPATLEASGIRWCLATNGGGASNERNLPYHAATAIAHGLAIEAGWRAVTSSVAELLGVGDRLGTLQRDKLATLLVTDGHPLETTTRVVKAFIGGRAVDLRSKQTQLADKYREKYRQLGLLPPRPETADEDR